MFLTFIFAIIWLFILIALIFFSNPSRPGQHRAAPPPELANDKPKQ